MSSPSPDESAEPVPPVSAPESGTVVPDMEELQQWLPHYQFQHLIAVGGMGAVYLAWQPGVERWVAIKVLPRETAMHAEDAERFCREARALAKLAHPNIVGIFDFGQTEAGHLYLVLEHVEGADLHWRTRAGEVTPERARLVITQMCDALQFAHEHGVIHRDIKPANILITPAWQVKVADFGLAQDLGAEGATGSQENFGTPEYTAPERFVAGAQVDHRADVYSLGVVIHEILTGKTPKAAGAAAGLGLPPGFAGVLSKCLMQDPARRFQTAREVKQALISALKEVEHKTEQHAGKTATASHAHAPHHPRPLEPVPMPVRSPRAPAWRGSLFWGLACLVAVGGFAWLVWRDHFRPPADPAASPGTGGPAAVPATVPGVSLETKPSAPPVSEPPVQPQPVLNVGTSAESFTDMSSNIATAGSVVSDSETTRNSMNKTIPAAIAIALGTTSAFSVDYASQIVPILRTKCYDCHSEAKGKEKGDVALDTEAKMKANIGPGQHIVPGSPEKSTMLIVCKLPDDDSDVMPPKGKNRLTKDELALLENWIKEGANLAGGGGSAPAPTAAPATMPAAAVQNWTSSDGKVIQATFISLAGDNITLKRADGQEFTFPLSRLSAESQAQARTAAGN